MAGLAVLATCTGAVLAVTLAPTGADEETGVEVVLPPPLRLEVEEWPPIGWAPLPALLGPLNIIEGGSIMSGLSTRDSLGAGGAKAWTTALIESSLWPFMRTLSKTNARRDSVSPSLLFLASVTWPTNLEPTGIRVFPWTSTSCVTSPFNLSPVFSLF